MEKTSYLIGLGSNRGHGRHARPAAMIAAALAALARQGLAPRAVSRFVTSRALGPGGRGFVNAAALIESADPPPALLARLKRLEAQLGRRRGRRWGMRPIDLDILAWSGGRWPPPPRARTGRLLIPHPGLASRGFALAPAASLAPGWRIGHPQRTLAQAEARRRHPRPVDRKPLRH
ncbi:2-amino-4-hydroxy-6-hydroxymethyldihydropteridine diphosphokinase [Sphingomonas morindae]|uniref:2-amino-4-hydroxy-6-hydroxymethyldihydropteridine pyrophosphokinase n=1 Tax=Sphingomonas morindae TaxID=1541170 RepID=A0ABY4X5X8_9SPHN|nr:2-amino-4-hydroxy-6-hydroxymethyldihydropteridine diphosphokinase [Sphingomonas morindae]USI72295.1 2-amino-4-hydroxy-6-hydroxymethyldihydropteridine diphosphokinase [Sphingomonas morindae]